MENIDWLTDSGLVMDSPKSFLNDTIGCSSLTENELRIELKIELLPAGGSDSFSNESILTYMSEHINAKIDDPTSRGFADIYGARTMEFPGMLQSSVGSN